MADITKIQLPSGNTYTIKDETARSLDITATYTAATYDLALDVTPAPDADSEEF